MSELDNNVITNCEQARIQYKKTVLESCREAVWQGINNAVRDKRVHYHFGPRADGLTVSNHDEVMEQLAIEFSAKGFTVEIRKGKYVYTIGDTKAEIKTAVTQGRAASIIVSGWAT